MGKFLDFLGRVLHRLGHHFWFTIGYGWARDSRSFVQVKWCLQCNRVRNEWSSLVSRNVALFPPHEEFMFWQANEEFITEWREYVATFKKESKGRIRPPV